MKDSTSITLLFSQLSRDSQRYILSMAQMAKAAETGKEKELKDKVQKSK